MKFSILALICFAIILLGCHPASSDLPSRPAAADSFTNYSGRGVVIRLEPDGKSIIVRHEEITNYMKGMTMPFTVRDTNLLVNLLPGNVITFALTVGSDDAWISQLHVESAQAPEASRPSFRVVRDVQPLKVGDLLPEYHFTNELDQAVNLADYRGSVVAFTFFFTSCPYPLFCPKMCSNFEDAEELLLQTPGAPAKWHLFSVSFDPEVDSPSVLKSYARRYHYRPDQWNFLTGDLVEITAVAEQCGLDFWRENGSISHNLRTVVLDPTGRIFKIIPSNEWTPAMLVDAMKAAEHHTGEAAPADSSRR